MKAGTKERRPSEASKTEPGKEPKSEDEDQHSKEEDQAEDKNSQKMASETLAIDLDGIMDRARQLTFGSDNVRGYDASPDGKTLYFTRGSALYMIRLEDGKESKIAEGSFSDLTLSGDGKSIFYRSGSSVYKMTSSGGLSLIHISEPTRP